MESIGRPETSETNYNQRCVTSQKSEGIYVKIHQMVGVFGGVLYCGGPRWRSWLRHCATSQKVAGSIPDGVIGIFH